MTTPITWHKAADPGEIEDGQVKPFTAGSLSMVLCRLGNRYGALEDRCPHAGGSLSQGAIENGLLVCPWHGREYDPLTGQCEGHQAATAHPVEIRDDGIFVAA